MKVCGNYHDEIVFDNVFYDTVCPLCRMRDNYERIIDKLKEEPKGDT